MSSQLKLYGIHRSPPVRAVLFTLKALELDFEFITVDTATGEQKSPDYLKKNPTHTVPTLEDDGKFIWDSHAICAYLVRKYAKDDALYPKDHYQRAVVDQRLHYENSFIFMNALKPAVGLLLRGNPTKQEFEEKLLPIFEAYDVLEIFLETSDYMAGSNLTIADFSLVTSVSSSVFVAPLDAAKWPKLAAWLERMKKLPYFEEVNNTGDQLVKDMINQKLVLLK